MTCRATQDGLVIVESSDKTWFTGEGNGKPLQYSYLENPMNSMKRQKDMTLKHELLGWLVSYCYEGKSGEKTLASMKEIQFNCT